MSRLFAYVVSGSGGSPTLVTPVDTFTHTAGTPMVLAKGGQSIVATPNGKTLFIPIISLSAVVPIDLHTHTVLPAIPVGADPFPIVVTPDGRTVLVGNTSSHSVTAIHVANRNVLANIPVGDTPSRLVITPDGARVYVVNSGSTSVTPIDMATAGRRRLVKEPTKTPRTAMTRNMLIIKATLALIPAPL